jgi:hypothetical protein
MFESEGGWILDNFPESSEQLQAMLEINIVPDTFIVLSDSSDNFSILTQRWYMLNKQAIDKKIFDRVKREDERRAMEKEYAYLQNLLINKIFKFSS